MNAAHPFLARIRTLESRLRVVETIIATMECRPQLRKKDLARHFTCSLDTIENATKDGRLPKPVYVFGPLWTPAQIQGVVSPLR